MTNPARSIAAPGSVLLFLAMFMPALEVCDKPFYPMQAPMLLAPYLFGGTAFAVFVATSPGARRVWGIVARVFGGLTLAMLGLIAHLVAAGERSEPLPVFLSVLWWPLAILFVRTCWGERPGDERLARAIALPAFGGTVWFGLFLSTEDVMWGMGVAFLGSILVTAGAVVWELDLRRRAWPDVERIPRAIVR